MVGITSLTDKDRIFTNVYGFQGADLKSAQARGDFQVLLDRGRRALRVHIGGDVGLGEGLEKIKATVAA